MKAWCCCGFLLLSVLGRGEAQEAGLERLALPSDWVGKQVGVKDLVPALKGHGVNLNMERNQGDTGKVFPVSAEEIGLMGAVRKYAEINGWDVDIIDDNNVTLRDRTLAQEPENPFAKKWTLRLEAVSVRVAVDAISQKLGEPLSLFSWAKYSPGDARTSVDVVNGDLGEALRQIAKTANLGAYDASILHGKGGKELIMVSFSMLPSVK